MSMFIHHELFLVIQALRTGAVLLLCYDLLRVFRKYAVPSRKISNAQDILGLVAGAGLCHLTVSPFFVKFCGILFDICIIIGKKIIKWLLFPVRRGKIFWYKHVVKGRLANWVILRRNEKRKETEK